jgi:hypothetical protein
MYLETARIFFCPTIETNTMDAPATTSIASTSASARTSTYTSQLDELEEAYQNWEEAERMHADLNRVYDIIDTLRPSDVNELEYQTRRLKHSPAYFSGHVACCSDTQNGALAWARRTETESATPFVEAADAADVAEDDEDGDEGDVL